MEPVHVAPVGLNLLREEGEEVDVAKLQELTESYKGQHLGREPDRPKSLGICKRCQSIDFKAVFRLSPYSFRKANVSFGRRVFDLGPMLLMRTLWQGCSFCKILKSKVEAFRDTWPKEQLRNWYLEAFPALWLKARDLKTYAAFCSPILSVGVDGLGDSTQWIIPMASGQDDQSDTPYFKGSPLHQIGINYERLRLRIAECHNAHLCSEMRSSRALPETMTVIDCVTRTIVPLPPSSNYICLSYVWGQDQPPSIDEARQLRLSKALPRDLPKTLEDSICVTLNLGQRYLWIDRYCVDQYHSEIKKQQIAAMADIFEGALLTLVALAVSATSGLPGVSDVRRTPQRRFVVDGGEYLVTSPDLRHHLKQSTWETRAWTHQEAVLSKRLLYFTPDQTILVCGLGEAPEEMSTLPPLKVRRIGALHSYSGTVCMLNRYMLHPRSGFSKLNRLSTGELFHRQLRDYRSRHLTYGSDTLNAFRGILSRAPFRSFWGVPIYLEKDIDSGGRGQVSDSVPSHSRGLVCGMLWRCYEESSPSAGKRRTMFPSWSWASVRTNICFLDTARTVTPDSVDCQCQHLHPMRLQYRDGEIRYCANIFVATPDGSELLTFEQLHDQSRDNMLPEASHVLHVETYITPWNWSPTKVAYAHPLDGRVLRKSRLFLEDPGDLMMSSAGSSGPWQSTHYMTWDAESFDEYTAVKEGEVTLKAILMLETRTGKSAHDEYQGALFWLAVVFTGNVEKRVGVIQSCLNSECRLNKERLEYGVWQLA